MCSSDLFGYADSKMAVSDMITGIVLALAGIGSYKTNRKIFFLLAALLGIWLQLSPLFFWAKEAAAYTNATFTGIIVILLAFQVHSMTGEELDEVDEIPPGWSFNPSAWKPRVVTVGLALVSWFLARYLTAYQLGYIDQIHDPFTGEGTIKVITSSVARFFPVPDAGLGAFGYTLDFLLGIIGSSRRWRTMPWLSVFFGLMVVPAGFISVVLIILQPLLVGAWCGICLTIASCMLVMILLTLPEMAAVIQLLSWVRKTNRDFWGIFWNGISKVELSKYPGKVMTAKRRRGFSELGFTCPWNLVLSILIGGWLMLSPGVLGINQPAADVDYIVGPLLITFSIISMSEVTRHLRFANIALGFTLLVTPVWAEGFSFIGAVNDVFFGVLVMVLSLRKGLILEHCGKK